MINIVYNPFIITTNLTGNTTDYSASNSAITSGIYISSGFTLNITEFDKQTINRTDIIGNIINYISDGTNKYIVDILIVDSGYTYSNVTKTGNYCVELSLSGVTLDYLIMNVSNISSSIITVTSGSSVSSSDSSGITYLSGTDIILPVIYYNTGNSSVKSYQMI